MEGACSAELAQPQLSWGMVSRCCNCRGLLVSPPTRYPSMQPSNHPPPPPPQPHLGLGRRQRRGRHLVVIHQVKVVGALGGSSRLLLACVGHGLCSVGADGWGAGERGAGGRLPTAGSWLGAQLLCNVSPCTQSPGWLLQPTPMAHLGRQRVLGSGRAAAPALLGLRLHGRAVHLWHPDNGRVTATWANQCETMAA